MSLNNSQDDKNLMNALTQRINALPRDWEYNNEGKITRLNLSSLMLTELPIEISQLTSLQILDISGNYLVELPSFIGSLRNIKELYLHGNMLNELPSDLGLLEHLEYLEIDNSSTLLSPPPEIIRNGTKAILAYLRDLHENSLPRFEAKLLLVGEGGTGKSSLLRSLRDEGFDPYYPTTHGIEVEQLGLQHPNREDTEILLNCWDFGGQEIYHATHQFFLTQRSLYLVVWNARLGWEQGRLHYWLNTIKALAPDAPILLVATHIDERAPDVNYTALQSAFPQLKGNLSVSNENGAGIDVLLKIIQSEAALLPLMGQPWPQTWLASEKALTTTDTHHLSTNNYTEICAANGVTTKLAKGEFGGFLHDLGKILYFQDDDVLRNLVVLKPNWITKAISRVLTDERIRSDRGLLSHNDLSRIWGEDENGLKYDRLLYPVFLRLMERFDLSYQIENDIPGDHPTRSLVPQLLPHQPPSDLPAIPSTPPTGQKRLEMIYRLNFVPAGIMPWFIVRTHRYTRSLHWRDGVVLEYEGHIARVELNYSLREVRLLVWGWQPHNFFTILKETMDLILGRFEGLHIDRLVPCICHWEQPDKMPCQHTYDYNRLVARLQANRKEVECDLSFNVVSVETLLFGIHESTRSLVITKLEDNRANLQHLSISVIYDLLVAERERTSILFEKLEDNQQRIIQQNLQLTELLIRTFTRQWNYLTESMNLPCPTTFFITPSSKAVFNPKDWFSEQYNLHLMCQHPLGPHPVGQMYPIREAEQWWITIRPLLNQVLQFLKFAAPISKASGTDIGLLEAVIKAIPELPNLNNIKGVTKPEFINQQAEGPALRALNAFLKQVDPLDHWGGLYKIITPL